MSLTRSKLIKKLRSMSIEGKEAFFNKSEDFNGVTGGIWTGGEGNPSMKIIEGDHSMAFGMFEYWSGVRGGFPYDENAIYAENGVLKEVNAVIEESGWGAEWNDGGTLMIWRDY